MADSTSSTEPTVPDVKWRQRFAANERMKQIVAVEKAAKSSINCLNHMKSTLAAEADPSLARICQLWQSGIGKVLPTRTFGVPTTCVADLNLYIR